METGRGKKSKKGWHLTLGLKETIFAGIGVVGLMMMSFALGALAGRGDIYRVASNWGLMSREAPQMAQWAPSPGVPGGPPAQAPAPVAAAAPPLATTAAAPAAIPTPKTVAKAKPARPAPVTASITPLSPPVPAASAKKKGKTSVIHHDKIKAREAELERLRREVATKLSFQNSCEDTSLKSRLPKPKEQDKAHAKGAKSQPTLVRVAQYKSSKEAQAKVAELQKKGVKATVKKSKDAKGTIYIVCKPGSAPHPDAERLAKKEKSGTAAPKNRPNKD